MNLNLPWNLLKYLETPILKSATPYLWYSSIVQVHQIHKQQSQKLFHLFHFSSPQSHSIPIFFLYSIRTSSFDGNILTKRSTPFSLHTFFFIFEQGTICCSVVIFPIHLLFLFVAKVVPTTQLLLFCFCCYVIKSRCKNRIEEV